ncbi:MAG TPA: ATP-binding protein [Chryseolinea sp.]
MHFYEAAQRGDSLFVEEVEGEALAELYRYLGSLLVSQGISSEVRTPGYTPPTYQINHVAYFSYGYLLFVTYKKYPEAHEIFKRFAKVFEQTYTRFLDLEKAEAQVRESHIEASLERVRGKTMAMHNSQDVGDTVATVFDELLKLNIKTNRCGILIFSNSTDAEVWTAKSAQSEKVNLIIGHLDVTRHPMLTMARNSWKNKETSFTYELIGDDLVDYYGMINNQPDYPMRVNMESLPSKEIHTEFYFPDGAVFAFTSDPIAPEDTQIFKRLASVFGQTYRRYLDLQKAEAQAREAQIETALERVRSRTMAMHESKEIADIVGRIFKELTLLDVTLNRVLIWIFNPGERYLSWWSANPEEETNAESYRVDFFEHPVFLSYYEAWQKRTPLLLYTLADELKESWEDHLFTHTELSRLPKAVRDGMRSERKIFTTSAISDYGLLMAGSFEPFSDEVNDIIQRFGRVFQQSYTRYLDVQKAEEQAREATIEASLEKVRGKAMGMHDSKDLVSTASLVFTELKKLGINTFRSGVGLLTKENRNVKLYSAASSEEGGSFTVVGWAVLDHHPVLSKTYDSWVNNEDYFPLLKGEMLKSYYEKVVATFNVPVEQSEGYEQHGYFLPFSEGMFYGWSEKPYTETQIKILHRFRGIVDLTFRRYMELQKSEENAREAIRQASLDRVRAEIASMRTTSDLDRITPLIWKELNILSIPFVRCGVFIMDDLQQLMHTFLSTPEGEAIAAFHLPYQTPGNTGEILSHWKNKQMYIKHWDETAFSELGELLVQQGAIPSKEVYMNTVPVGGIHLHCLPFLQGMLYVGNTSQLQDSDIHLIQSVADAFSTAYARYEDFNKLESAKAQIERTLTDLKQTQTLLVQSEKMASLGELTAGIAHEIQNPLNFVNNFSEVSNELLLEMKEELQKGNYSEVQTITDDIRLNLEKILHHGKRADGIVKGMLQHSRSSSGVKEPTDINALVDEYLRLAYHGYRAKDKSFNASTITDLDKNIGKVNVVPQDIGRVVLNLITNAFYAVTEKQNNTTAAYRPTVSLSTKKVNGCVSISVKDNGKGIPPKVLDKIFQPFFTTKPTGQGTGLGLSLSYDIVKAHGGELKVETKEGEGSGFIIQLPIN